MPEGHANDASASAGRKSWCWSLAVSLVLGGLVANGQTTGAKSASGPADGQAGASGPSAEAPSQPGHAETAAALLKRGLEWHRKREYRRAISAFDRVLALDPTSAPAHAYRAESWRARYYADRAIADWTEAIRLDPRNCDYRLGRAGVWSSHGQHERAMADYNDAVALAPNDPALYVARGNEWRHDLKLDRALADYNRALQINPNYADAYICRAIVARQRRQFAQAVAELAAALRIAPNHAEAHRMLARVLATCTSERVRDGARAFREASRACELTGWRDADCLDTLAAAYAECGDYDRAVQWQTKALELSRKTAVTPLQRTLNAGGRRGVGFDDRLAFYKQHHPCRE